jgi:hypothetical protein
MPFARRRRVDLYLSAAARRLISVGGARFSAAARHPETPDPISHFLLRKF